MNGEIDQESPQPNSVSSFVEPPSTTSAYPPSVNTTFSDSSQQAQPPPASEAPLVASTQRGGKSPLLWISILAILIIVSVAFFYFFSRASLVKLGTKVAKETTPPPTQMPTGPLSSSPSPIFSFLPATGSSSLRFVEGIGVVGIEIVTPVPNAIVSSPLTVKGNANEFEGQVSLRLKDADGTILGTGFATACMGEEPCPFETQVNFSQPAGTTGTLEAFALDAADGSEKDLLVITVRFTTQ